MIAGGGGVGGGGEGDGGDWEQEASKLEGPSRFRFTLVICR